MTKHTEGPWRREGTAIYSASCVIARTDEGGDYDYLEGGGAAQEAEDNANAVLIAAAPDLLAACEAAWSEYLNGKRTKGTHEMLSRAIQKARGTA